MFDLMYEEFYNPATGRMERRKLSARDVEALLSDKSKNRSDLLDLNVVYKRQTDKSMLTVRLSSWTSDKMDDHGKPCIGADGYPLRERIVKFLFESGQYDQSRQQGSRMTSYMQFHMDIKEFAYFCELMKSGRIAALIRRNEAKKESDGRKYAEPAFELCKEVRTAGAEKKFRVYKGSYADICIETSQRPLQGTQTGGQTASSVRIMHGLSLKEAGELGAMGELALETLNMWQAFGKADENLSIINARPRKESRQPASAERDERTAARRRDVGRGDRYDDGYGRYGYV